MPRPTVRIQIEGKEGELNVDLERADIHGPNAATVSIAWPGGPGADSITRNAKLTELRDLRDALNAFLGALDGETWARATAPENR
jgi:hypothetical protein